jgi:aminoglycoside 6'-N-acetyltransferase
MASKRTKQESSSYDFRALTRRDLKLVASWLEEPHLRQWWGDPAEAIASIEEAMEDVATEPLIVELDGRPIAYLQSYDPHLEDGHPYQDQPFGTLGVDLSIGPPELVGQGHGSVLLAQFVEALFDEGAPRVVIDPHPDNRRAVRAYEKAGFRRQGERDTPFGRVLLMARDSDDGAIDDGSGDGDDA